MCLIAVAHRVSEAFPLVIAANRDENYDRPTHDVQIWPDAPEVAGGRDVVHGGSWLAIRRDGRFAAVTNLRGAVARPLSRGALVRDFVTSSEPPPAFADAVARRAHEYSGFHLIVGDREEMVHVSRDAVSPLPEGVHAFSNAPPGEVWPKVDLAAATLSAVIGTAKTAEHLVERLMSFLTTPRGAASIEHEVFIAGDRYGTRSSSVIVMSTDGIVFAEQTFLRRGVAANPMRFVALRM